MKNILKIFLTIAFLFNLAWADESKAPSLQLIRNATLKIKYGETTFLIDPMLAPKGKYEGFANTYRSELRNPLTELPFPIEEVLKGVDALIITHTHSDHWDEVAQREIPKNIPIFVQDEQDAKVIK